MTEAEEVALNMPLLPLAASMADACRFVRSQMPDESTTVVDEVARALQRRSTPPLPAAARPERWGLF